MPDLQNDPREAAAYWFARVHSGTLTVEETQQFNEWRQADPRHQQEYQALDEIWQASSLIPQDELRQLLEDAGSQPRPSRRHWLTGGAVVGAAVLTAGIGFIHVLKRAPSYEAEFATKAGEQKSTTLPDGSLLELNTRSRVVVHYYDDQRHIELLDGEVMFSVAHTVQRPFLVDAGALSVRVTGTQFAVRRDVERVEVAVQSGSVKVTTGPWWKRQTATLVANQRTRSQPNNALAVEAADLAVLTAWRHGKVVFKDQRLELVVQEINRYLVHPIHLADSRLKGLTLTGIFNVQDADAFLQALHGTLPVVVRRRADGGADIAFAR